MPLTTVFRTLVVLVVFLQMSCSSSLLVRNKRHVDGMFTSEFSRARGSAAIRKLINSALAGKRDVEENSFRTDAADSGPPMDSVRKGLPGLDYKTASERRSEEQGLYDKAEECFAILDLLTRISVQSLQPRNLQVN
ncbi:uncharacterized protein PAF06_016522 [Gastrophryne carolinensis]